MPHDVTSDIDNFWKAFDAAKGEVVPVNEGEVKESKNL